MAAHYIKEICALQPEGPYFLGGGSSGGVVAFEMAQQLHAQGQKVALLALIDTYLPSPRYMPNPKLCHSLVYRFAQRVDLYLGNLLLIGPHRQLISMLERSKVKIGEAIKRVTARLYPDIEPPLTRTLRKVLEANLQATRDYVPQVYPGRITLFLSREESVRSVHDSRLGWSELAADGLDLHLIPGSHSLSLNEPHVIVLAKQLRACLQKAQAIELRS
jgi:aspartate racemase